VAGFVPMRARITVLHCKVRPVTHTVGETGRVSPNYQG
jgi:hypothetical protein